MKRVTKAQLLEENQSLAVAMQRLTSEVERLHGTSEQSDSKVRELLTMVRVEAERHAKAMNAATEKLNEAHRVIGFLVCK